MGGSIGRITCIRQSDRRGDRGKREKAERIGEVGRERKKVNSRSHTPPCAIPSYRGKNLKGKTES